MDFIRENPDKDWDWNYISSNEFQKEKQLFIENAYNKYIAAYKIQQWWKHITMSPHYKIGRKFINRKSSFSIIYRIYSVIFGYWHKALKFRLLLFSLFF